MTDVLFDGHTREAFFQKLIQTFSLSLDFSNGHHPAIVLRSPLRTPSAAKHFIILELSVLMHLSAILSCKLIGIYSRIFLLEVGNCLLLLG